MKQAQQQAAAQAAQQQRVMQQQAALKTLADNPNYGYQDLERVMMAFPEQADHLRAMWSGRNAEQGRNELRMGMQAMAAIRSGSPEKAVDLFKRGGAASREQGDKVSAEFYEDWAQNIEENPEQARQAMALFLSQHPEAKKAFEGLSEFEENERAGELQDTKVRTAEAEATTAEAEAESAPQRFKLNNKLLNMQSRNLASQITDRARRYKLDEKKLLMSHEARMKELDQKSVNLPAGVVSAVNKEATKASEAEMQ